MRQRRAANIDTGALCTERMARREVARPDKKPFLLRVDPALCAEVERLRAHKLRSVNAQVEFLQRDALRHRGRLPAPLSTAASAVDAAARRTKPRGPA